ncbi:MAG: hypothetical protein ABW217_03570 [Polyangiaceae bacterium]
MVSAAACVLALGCGGDDPEPEAAVVWLNLVQGETNDCNRTTSFQLPEGSAPSTIQGQIDGTPREEDGAGTNVIDCSVRPASGGGFNISLSLRATPDIRLFEVSGTVNEGASQVRVSVQSDRVGALQQQVCDADVQVIRNGAVWIRTLNCSDMTDPLSPSTRCAATGGVLFERCQG